MLLGEEAKGGPNDTYASGSTNDAYLSFEYSGPQSDTISTRHSHGAGAGYSEVNYLDGHVKAIQFPEQALTYIGSGVQANPQQYNVQTGNGSIQSSDCVDTGVTPLPMAP